MPAVYPAITTPVVGDDVVVDASGIGQMFGGDAATARANDPTSGGGFPTYEDLLERYATRPLPDVGAAGRWLQAHTPPIEFTLSPYSFPFSDNTLLPSGNILVFDNGNDRTRFPVA